MLQIESREMESRRRYWQNDDERKALAMISSLGRGTHEGIRDFSVH